MIDMKQERINYLARREYYGKSRGLKESAVCCLCVARMIGKRCDIVCSIRPPYQDHSINWIRNGKLVRQTFEPYQYIREEVQEWADSLGLVVCFEREPSFYFPGGTYLIEVMTNDEADNHGSR